MEVAESTINAVRTKDVIGTKVMNARRENIGKIAEIVLDKYYGRILYLVLESGTFLGLGGKYFALPWEALDYHPEEDAFVLNVAKEKLTKAPAFDKNHWPDVTSREWGDSINRYYGLKSYWSL